MSYEFYLKEITDVDETNKIPIAYCDEDNILFDLFYEQFISTKVRLCTNDINEIIIKINNIIKYEYNCLNHYDIKIKENKLQRISDFEHCIAQLDFINSIIKTLHNKDQYILMIRLKQDL